MMLGIAANMSFNVVDTFFIGQLGVTQLTAISFSFPVVIILLNLAIGVSIGLTSVLSRLLGAGKETKVKELSSQMTFLVLVASMALGVLGTLTIEPVFRFLGAGPESMGFINEYMIWAYWAMCFRMTSICVSGIFKAHGVTVVPSFAIFVTAFVNVVLDPILIFGWGVIPALGIQGAGLATFISNFIALLVEFFLAFRVYGLFGPLSFKYLHDLKDVMRIGAPSAGGNALNPISISLGNYFLSKSSPELVAGFGVASKIQIFTMIPILALSAALGPTVGQNFGNNRKDRVIAALTSAFLFSLFYGLFQGFLLYSFSDAIGSLFTDSAQAISFSSQYLEVVGWTLFGYSFVIVTSSALNAVGQPIAGNSVIALRTIIFFLALYFLFSRLNLDFDLIYAYSGANVLAAASSVFLAFAFIKKNRAA